MTKMGAFGFFPHSNFRQMKALEFQQNVSSVSTPVSAAQQ